MGVIRVLGVMVDFGQTALAQEGQTERSSDEPWRESLVDHWDAVQFGSGIVGCGTSAGLKSCRYNVLDNSGLSWIDTEPTQNRPWIVEESTVNRKHSCGSWGSLCRSPRESPPRVLQPKFAPLAHRSVGSESLQFSVMSLGFAGVGLGFP